MADKSVSVRFGGDSSELRADLELARASVRQFAAEARSLASQMQATGATTDSAMRTSLANASASAARAREEVASLNSQLKGGDEAGKAGGAGIGFYAREIHAMLDEGLSGRFRQLQGTAVNTLFTFAQSNPTMAAAVVGITAFTAAIGYMAVQASEKLAAVQSASASMAFAGNLNAAKGQISSYIDQLQKLPDVSAQDAAAMQAAIGGIRNYSTTLEDAAIRVLPAYADAAGTKLPDAMKKLSAVFDDPISQGPKFVEALQNVTTAEKDFFERARQTGDINTMNAAILAILTPRYANFQKALDAAKGSAVGFADALAVGGVEGETDNATEVLTEKLNQLTAAFKANMDVVTQRAAVIRATANTSEQAAESEADQQKRAAAALQTRLDDQEQFAILTRESELDATQNHLRTIAESLKNDQLSVADRIKINKQYFDTQAQMERQQTELTQAEARKRAAMAAPRSPAERSAQLAGANAAISGANPGSAAQIDAEAQKYALLRQFREEDEQDQASDEQSKYQNVVRSIDEQVSKIKELANASQMSRSEELTELLALDGQKEAAETAHYTRLQGIWDRGTQGYRTATRQMAEVAQQAALERQKTEEQVAQQIEADYKKSFEQIGSSFASGITGMIEGQSTLKQAAQGVAREMLQAFVQGRVKWVADQLAGLAAGRTIDAAKVASNASAETAITGAHEAGEAARAASTTSGALAQSATVAAGVLKSIQASAAEAFAGIFGFLSPVMGPAAAGPAAAGEAVVLGAGSAIPHMATGAWNLASDTLAQLHAGEMVVPATFASGMRSAMSGGGGGVSTAGGGHTHIHFNVSAIDTSGFRSFLKGGGLREIAKQLPGHWRLNPSVRP